MANKLTKTQTAILARAHNGFVCTSRGSGSGPDGGRIRYGIRESDAACKLRDMGMLEFVKHDKHIHYQRGHGIHTTDTKWKVIT